MVFSIFLCPSRQILGPEEYLELGHGQFFPKRYLLAFSLLTDMQALHQLLRAKAGITTRTQMSENIGLVKPNLFHEAQVFWRS